ncbi:hypothetical protein JYG23_11430 [Sedimentibacter sp. zth1]|uniref:O-antigen ligase family protein n=1 Tax=Sedimentibacter sp. zth1 TaxID=2816908 RepID=UPI001A917FF7|nr:hypothetical protein [Sedimentibacter sp. zth1]QSX05283.1 hypothetical protein JYG23_11430 [Sedimentibacter sp. zth1]
MVKNYKTNLTQLKNSIFLYFLIGIILLFPESAKGIMIYVPQLIVAGIAAYLMLKISINKITKLFLMFALFMTVMNVFLSTINSGENISNIIVSSLRLYYPFVGLIIGSWIKKNVKQESLLKALTFFLILQFIVSYLQIKNEGFRVWSFTLYRASNLENYLIAFSWETGKRAIGTIGNPNILGLLVVLFNSTILVLSECIKNRFIKRIIVVLSIITSLYVSIYTQSRTTILLWVLTTVLIAYMKYSKTALTSIIYSFASIVVIVSLLIVIQDDISRDISLVALDSRFDIWLLRIRQMFEKTKYMNVFASILGIGYTTARELGTFDNIYVKYFVSGGIIGFTIFLKTIIDTAMIIFRKLSNNVSRRLGKVVLFLWVLGSFVAEYQEMFKLSIITFMVLGYALYSNSKK